jgi:hypothetical protein
MIEMLGGENAIDAKGLKIKKSVGSVRFSMERKIMENPRSSRTTMGDSRKDRGRMKKEMLADPAWRGVKAVKDGKGFFLPTNSSSTNRSPLSGGLRASRETHVSGDEMVSDDENNGRVQEKGRLQDGGLRRLRRLRGGRSPG